MYVLTCAIYSKIVLTQISKIISRNSEKIEIRSNIYININIKNVVIKKDYTMSANT